MVRAGELGKILKIVTEYPQGWLLNPIDQEGQKQSLVSAPIRSVPARVAALATSALTAKIWLATLAGWKLKNFAPTSRRLSKADGLKTTAICSCATRVAHAACSMLRRSPPARRTISRSGSMAPRHLWNGIRNIPTNLL